MVDDVSFIEDLPDSTSSIARPTFFRSKKKEWKKLKAEVDKKYPPFQGHMIIDLNKPINCKLSKKDMQPITGTVTIDLVKLKRTGRVD